MKLKKLKISVWLGALSLVVVLVLGSCNKEPLLPNEQQNKEYMDFTLELTPPGAFSSGGTRVLTDTEQNTIASAEVLVFQDNKLQYHIRNNNIVDNKMTVSLKTSQSESELFDIMVIANPPASTDFDFIPYIGKSKEELQKALNIAITGKWAGSKFMMYGEVPKTLIKPTTNHFKITMLRSLARIDIGVGAYTDGTWAGLKDVFELTEVRVVNTRNKFAVIPTATALDVSGNVKVSTPSIPEDTGVNSAITYAEITDSKYIQSTIFIAEAPNTTDKVKLIVGGRYKNSTITTYYRIDMCVPKVYGTGYDYLNILRNHLYRISVTSVTGAGFLSAEEALKAEPINIATTLEPIEEGGWGDIIFDGNNYLQTDVSSVQIYGEPDGMKSYDMVKVKASFTDGVTNSITIAGVTTQLTLANGVGKLISCVIPKGTTAGDLTIRIGRLTKVIPFTVQAPVDAHFDFLPFMDVASIKVVTPQVWLTLSHNTTYVASEQQPSQIEGNAQGKACLHFDEYIDTKNAPRTAQALVKRNNFSGITRVHIEQLNLKGMVVGMFGGVYANETFGYPYKLAVEAVEEFRKRLYDDTSIGKQKVGVLVGFYGITTGVNDHEYGKAGTIKLALREGDISTVITPPYTIYNNYQARYCYDKNRDKDGNGKIDDAEVVWYLPAANQLMSVWVANITEFINSSSTGNDYYYGSVTEFSTTGTNGNSKEHTYSFNFNDGFVTYGLKSYIIPVRCVRDLP